MMLEPAYSAIDKAIRENRFGEYLIYVLSTLIVFAGIFAIIYGALKREGLVALSGSIATALIYPPLRVAREMRRQNIAVRLLEASLTIATASEEAARVINEAFQQVFTRANNRSSVAATKNRSFSLFF